MIRFVRKEGENVKKKDILFLCQFFYPEYISSATLPYDTACALKQAGYSVDALCGYPREYAKGAQVPLKEHVDGIHIHRLKYLQLNRKGFFSRLVNYFSFTFMVFLHLLKMAKYKAVVVYSNPPILPWIASWAKALFGTKLIFVAYDLYPEVATRTNTLREGNIICRLMDHINRCVYRRADAVVALSREMRDYILQNRPIEGEKVHVIPNWYEDTGSVFSDRAQNPLKEVTKGRFTVSYFGNMGTAQDMQTIRDAILMLKEDPDIFFLFAGHGNKMQALKQELEGEQVENVKIFDFLHGEDFRNALQISDCALVCLEKGLTGLCVPSKTYSYMMQGIPLLAIMDEGDIVSDIQAGAGRWVRNGEGDRLAETIREMRNDSEALAEMRRVCREIYLNKYTKPICTEQYVSVFRGLVSQDHSVYDFY